MSWYKAGSVAVTNGSAAVVGTGTLWVANAAAGHTFVGPDHSVYEVQSVNSDTSITLARTYRGSTASAQPYDIAPTQDYLSVLAAQVGALLTTYGDIAAGPGAGKFGDGSAASPAITFAADLDTGFYRPGANTIGFATSGLGRMFIDANGKFGLGVSSPLNFAQFRPVNDVNLGVAQGVVDVNAAMLNAFDNAGTSVGMEFQANQWIWQIGGTARMRLDANGLGLNGAAPTADYAISALGSVRFIGGDTAAGYSVRVLNFAQNGGGSINAPTGAAGGISISADSGPLQVFTGGHLSAVWDVNGNLFLVNTAAAPSTPAGSGVLYVEGGALKYRGSCGTLTVVGPA